MFSDVDPMKGIRKKTKNVLFPSPHLKASTYSRISFFHVR